MSTQLLSLYWTNNVGQLAFGTIVCETPIGLLRARAYSTATVNWAQLRIQHAKNTSCDYILRTQYLASHSSDLNGFHVFTPTYIDDLKDLTWPEGLLGEVPSGLRTYGNSFPFPSAWSQTTASYTSPHSYNRLIQARICPAANRCGRSTITDGSESAVPHRTGVLRDSLPYRVTARAARTRPKLQRSDAILKDVRRLMIEGEREGRARC